MNVPSFIFVCPKKTVLYCIVKSSCSFSLGPHPRSAVAHLDTGMSQEKTGDHTVYCKAVTKHHCLDMMEEFKQVYAFHAQRAVIQTQTSALHECLNCTSMQTAHALDKEMDACLAIMYCIPHPCFTLTEHTKTFSYIPNFLFLGQLNTPKQKTCCTTLHCTMLYSTFSILPSSGEPTLMLC